MPFWRGGHRRRLSLLPPPSDDGRKRGRSPIRPNCAKKNLANILSYMMLLLTCFSQMSFMADMLACWPELLSNLDQEVSKLWPKVGAGQVSWQRGQGLHVSGSSRVHSTSYLLDGGSIFVQKLQVWNKMCSFCFSWHMGAVNTWLINWVNALMCSK